MTRGYEGFKGVAGGYKRLQGVTWRYRGLKVVAGGYKE